MPQSTYTNLPAGSKACASSENKLKAKAQEQGPAAAKKIEEQKKEKQEANKRYDEFVYSGRSTRD